MWIARTPRGSSIGRSGRDTELVLLNFNSGLTALKADDAAASHQFQWRLVIELGRPTDRQFQPASGQQDVFTGEENPVTAHIDGSTDAHLVSSLFADYLVPDVAFDGESIRAAPVFALRVRMQ